jgi:hypothetical protein
MFSSYASDFVVVWSEYVEQETDRRLRGNQATVRSVRTRAAAELSPTGSGLFRFSLTHPKDRQVLADAIAAAADMIITEDVDDFDESEVIAAGIAAVNPDLFLAECVTSEAYAQAVRRMSSKMSTPARTPEQLHTRIGRQHPLATTAHRAVFNVEPDAAINAPPAVIYRGNRCLRCLRTITPLLRGVCQTCLSEIT